MIISESIFEANKTLFNRPFPENTGPIVVMILTAVEGKAAMDAIAYWLNEHVCDEECVDGRFTGNPARPCQTCIALRTMNDVIDQWQARGEKSRPDKGRHHKVAGVLQDDVDAAEN